jgi:hypothetical protein
MPRRLAAAATINRMMIHLIMEEPRKSTLFAVV